MHTDSMSDSIRAPEVIKLKQTQATCKQYTSTTSITTRYYFTMPEVSMQAPFSRDPAQRLRQRSKHRNHNHNYNHKNSQKAQPEQNRSLESSSNLVDRIFSLPGEIRLEIHRQILVRPCKYNLRHKDTCDGHAFITPHSYTFRNTQTVLRCANCRAGPWGH